MKIIFFTQEDPFYVKIFFDEFFKYYEKLHELKAVVISRTMGKKSAYKLAKQMYNFYGLYDFTKMGIKFAYLKLMSLKNVKMSHSAVTQKTFTIKQLANSYGLNVIERSDLNSPDFQQLIAPYAADLFISVASPIIWKENLIRMPKLDCINIHNAPLPKYRGMLPNFWQLYNGETEAGITIHRIDSGIDTGDIIAQRFVKIVPRDSLHDMIVKTKRKGAELMIDVISDFQAGKIKYNPVIGRGSYFSFPTRNDVKEFKNKGKHLL